MLRSRTGCAPTGRERLSLAMCRSTARAFTKPLCGGEGWTSRPRRGARHGCRALFVRAGARSKSPAAPHALAGPQARPAPRGVPFSLVTFLYSGHPALRPSGRLRRSHALLRVREQAKKSDPAFPRGLASRRRQEGGSPRQASPIAETRQRQHQKSSCTDTMNMQTGAKGGRAQGALLQGNERHAEKVTRAAAAARKPAAGEHAGDNATT